jgi:hypothetical protein
MGYGKTGSIRGWGRDAAAISESDLVLVSGVQMPLSRAIQVGVLARDDHGNIAEASRKAGQAQGQDIGGRFLNACNLRLRVFTDGGSLTRK